MSNVNVADVAAKLYKLLQPLEDEERKKVVTATLVLFGETPSTSLAPVGNGKDLSHPVIRSVVPHPKPALGSGDPPAFFAEKDPKNKGEELAVAALYRELHGGTESHTKEDFKTVILAARRNFDAKNFTRDMNNARNQAGLFNKGAGEKGSYTLSYYGQQYVSALPDREKAKALRRPKGTGGKRSRVEKGK